MARLPPGHNLLLHRRDLTGQQILKVDSATSERRARPNRSCEGTTARENNGDGHPNCLPRASSRRSSVSGVSPLTKKMKKGSQTEVICDPFVGTVARQAGSLEVPRSTPGGFTPTYCNPDRART